MIKHDIKKKRNVKNKHQIKNVRMAPIIVFAYNRVDKLKRLLDTLEKNNNTQKMELYIFVDIPFMKNKKDIKYNQRVIEFLKNYQLTCKKYKRVQVEIAEYHKGLAESIISGVTKIINKYGKAIILEDDLEVSEDFLDYMQRGLEFYKKDKKIWALTGYSPVFNIPSNYVKDVFLIPRSESLGWGTWQDRWNRCDWQVKTYEKFSKNIIEQILFNIGGNDLSQMLKMQMQTPQFDSWAIRWGYHQFLEKKYTVYPIESRVIHCGNDNRSTHGPYFDTQKLKDNYKKCQFVYLKPNWKVIWQFRKVFNIPLTKKIKSIIYKILK